MQEVMSTENTVDLNVFDLILETYWQGRPLDKWSMKATTSK